MRSVGASDLPAPVGRAEVFGPIIGAWTNGSSRASSRRRRASPRSRSGRGPSGVHRPAEAEGDARRLPPGGAPAARAARPRPPLRAPGPRQDDARPHHRARDGGADPRHGRARPREGGRPRGDPDEPRAGRRPLHRRDPPDPARRRGDPLPRARGREARPRHRHGAGRADGRAAAPAVHARRRDDARGPPLAAAHRALRHHAPPRLLRRRRPQDDRPALGRDPRLPDRRRRRRRDRAAQPRDAAHREPAPPARARLRRGGGGDAHLRARRRAALDQLEVDHFGLDELDRRILATIIERFGGGPVGLSALAHSLGEDKGTLEDLYEPFLLQSGFLPRTPKGRVATALAYRHLGLKPARVRERCSADAAAGAGGADSSSTTRAGGAARADRVDGVVARAAARGLHLDRFRRRGRGTRPSSSPRASGSGPDLVAVAGGDGTVGEAAEALLGRAMPLAILPAGTTNVVAREFGVADPRVAEEALFSATTRPLTVFHAAGRASLIGTGVGFDARVMANTVPVLKRLFGRAGIGWTATLEWMKYEFPPIEVEGVDAEGKPFRREATFVLSANTARYGGDPILSPFADPDDDLLDLVLFTSRSRKTLSSSTTSSRAGRPRSSGSRASRGWPCALHGALAGRLRAGGAGGRRRRRHDARHGRPRGRARLDPRAGVTETARRQFSR